MSTMQAIEDFAPMIEAGLKDSPIDFTPYLLCADWCEENERERTAAGLRWLAERNLAPFVWSEGNWFWFPADLPEGLRIKLVALDGSPSCIESVTAAADAVGEWLEETP